MLYRTPSTIQYIVALLVIDEAVHCNVTLLLGEIMEGSSLRVNAGITDVNVEQSGIRK